MDDKIKCFLCSGKTHYNARVGTHACEDDNCVLRGIGWVGYEWDMLAKQITKIRHDAKQELIADIDDALHGDFDLYNDSMGNYARLKKKHGIE